MVPLFIFGRRNQGLARLGFGTRGQIKKHSDFDGDVGESSVVMRLAVWKELQ